jgi:uncharacterized DUF497 family protein
VTTLRFEWDEAKNESNLRKHGVGFDEAALAFRDPLYVSVREREVDGEERWQTFGMVRGVLLLMVAHLVWEEGATEVVRIISARRATKEERRLYEDENG